MAAEGLTVNYIQGHAAQAKIIVDHIMDVTGQANLLAGAAVTGNITVTGTVDGVDLQTLDGQVTTIETNYLDKTSASANTIAGNVTLADDKVLALGASGTGATSLATFTNSVGEIARIETASNELKIRLQQSGGVFNVISSSGQDAIKIVDNGIITGPSSGPTAGTYSGKVINSTGIMFNSVDSNATKIHQYFYTPSGTAGTISTNTLTTTYGVSSDPRIKDFLEDLTDAEIDSEFIKARNACKVFTYKVDSSIKTLGFDAHKAVDAKLMSGLGYEGEGPRDAELGSVYDTTEEKYTDIEIMEVDGEEVEVEVEKTRTIEHKVTPAGVDQGKLVPLLLLKMEMDSREFKDYKAETDAKLLAFEARLATLEA